MSGGPRAPTAPSDVDGALAFFAARAPGARPRAVVADVDFDDDDTWWTIRVVLAFDDEVPAWAAALPTLDVGPYRVVRLVVAERPGHPVAFDAPELRGPALALGEAIAARLGVPFATRAPGDDGPWWEEAAIRAILATQDRLPQRRGALSALLDRLLARHG